MVNIESDSMAIENKTNQMIFNSSKGIELFRKQHLIHFIDQSKEFYSEKKKSIASLGMMEWAKKCLEIIENEKQIVELLMPYYRNEMIDCVN